MTIVSDTACGDTWGAQHLATQLTSPGRSHPLLKDRHTKAQSLARLQVDLGDLSDDLDELQFLLNDLLASSSTLGADDNHPLFQELENVSQLITNTNLRQQQLQTRLQTGSVGYTELSNLRDRYLQGKTSLRRILRQRGLLACIADWQSPIYAATHPSFHNNLSDGIREHVLDYKRDGHLEAAAYEQQFIDAYVSHLGSQRVHAYLANSGMAAFSSVIHWIAHELKLTRALLVEPMYFENIHLLTGYFPRALRFSPDGESDIDAVLAQYDPSVVFVDAVSNCNDVIAHNFQACLEWAKQTTSDNAAKAVVIDSTCLPTSIMQHDLLVDMPAHVTVVFVESLAKYHQFGMDVVTGGVTIIDADEATHSSYKKTRARHGANIADSSVGCLPEPNKDQLNRRMRRHSRNLRLMARYINDSITTCDSIIQGTSWLTDGSKTATWFNGTCLTLNFKSEYRSIANYQEFENLVLELCAAQSVPLALSTSFGFDVSRLYVTAPSTAFEPPFLRVSVGTEIASQIIRLSQIIMQAAAQCKLRWQAAATTEPAAAPPQTTASSLCGAFTGPDAVSEYLNPGNFAPPPLVELPADLNPFQADGVRIFAKIMPLVPLMNIKSIPAFSMLQMAQNRGELDKVQNVIESSSSNTVLSLSVIARLFGIDRTCAIVDHCLSPALERMLRLFGIEIFQHPAAGHELFGKLEPRSERARRLGSQPGWINPGQYSNPDNPDGFAKWLAPDLWAQTGGKLQLLSCALGTCGTMVGVARTLRAFNPSMQLVACCPSSGELIPGPREKSLLHDVQFDWQEIANCAYDLPATESFAASVRLLRRGIMGGPSSGMNYAGLLRHLAQMKASGELAKHTGNGEFWCAFLCCDSPLPHVEEYFNTLGDEFFPPVHDVPALEDSTIGC